LLSILFRKKLPSDRRKLGRWGERWCERYLRRRGLKTLARNFSCKTGEIDLVMVDGDRTVVFVEVKTRVDESFQPAESVITAAKKARMIRAARYFLMRYNIEDRPFRFDVVTVIAGRGRRPEIRHYQRAFVP